MLSIVCICMQEKVSDVCCAVGAVAIAALIDRAAHCAHHMSHLTCTPHLWQQERERVANVCRPVGAAAIAALMDEANKLGEDEICVICEWDMSQGWRIASWDSQGAGMLCDFYINSKKGVEGSSNPPDCDAAWKCSEVYLPLARVALWRVSNDLNCSHPPLVVQLVALLQESGNGPSKGSNHQQARMPDVGADPEQHGA
eukprot:1158830-Pelagomonas_calceolata.AAC.11